MDLTEIQFRKHKREADRKEEALFAWMQEVSGVLFYQADIAQSHKTDIANALEKYAKARSL